MENTTNATAIVAFTAVEYSSPESNAPKEPIALTMDANSTTTNACAVAPSSSRTSSKIDTFSRAAPIIRSGNDVPPSTRNEAPLTLQTP